jgi:hypothetical protein
MYSTVLVLLYIVIIVVVFAAIQIILRYTTVPVQLCSTYMSLGTYDIEVNCIFRSVLTKPYVTVLIWL